MLVRYDGPPDQVNHEVARSLAAQREPEVFELENQLETVPGETVTVTGTGGEASAVLEPGRAYNLPRELAEGLVATSQWWTRVTDYEKLSKDALLELAAEREIDGRSTMTKTELVKALRDAPSPPAPDPGATDEGAPGGLTTAPAGTTTATASSAGAPAGGTT